MVLHWEPNGAYSFDKGCWHRQTISIKLHEHLRHKVEPFRRLLESKGAEVFEVDQKTSTVVDIFYFMADAAEQALVDKLLREGKRLRRPTDSELTPKKSQEQSRGPQRRR